MPTPWKRSPEELHKTYIANTEAFYKVAGRGLAQELDEFVVSCALGLWKGSPRLGQQHVDAVNQLYSKGRKPGAYLLWELTEKVCKSADFLPPLFFWNLTEQDARRGTANSRIFVRMLTNILLYLAAVDDEVTMAEAEYITECSDKLTAICDGGKRYEVQSAHQRRGLCDERRAAVHGADGRVCRRRKESGRRSVRAEGRRAPKAEP